MSHRSITALALVVTGTLAATTVSMPAAFAADDENHVQSTVTPNSDTPAPEATQASSNDAQSGAPAPSDTTDEAGDPTRSPRPRPCVFNIPASIVSFMGGVTRRAGTHFARVGPDKVSRPRSSGDRAPLS